MLETFYFVQLNNHKPFKNDNENMVDPNYDQLRKLKISPRVICYVPILNFSGMEFPDNPHFLGIVILLFKSPYAPQPKRILSWPTN